MAKIFIVIISLVLSVTCLGQDFRGTYAIQNIENGKDLRPFDAGNQDNNKIVQYDHQNWKCMTWKFVPSGNKSYYLKNLFTGKSFQPLSTTIDHSALTQLPLSEHQLQEWEFIPAGKEMYLIRLKGTSYYITSPDNNTNTSVRLEKLNNSKTQKWKLIEQQPTM